MLKILRQLSPDEARQVALLCGARSGAAPEELIRCLCRHCGVYTWGLFPASSDEALLDQMGRRLGLPPYSGGTRDVTLRERAVLASYLRHGWGASAPETRLQLLVRARTAWDVPGLAFPELIENVEQGTVHPTLEALLVQSAGLRALAAAAEQVPIPLAAGGRVPGSFFGASERPANQHQAFYATLLILWRARSRVLRERRHQRLQLQREAKQVESLLAVRRRNLNLQPRGWLRDPRSGAALLAAAGVSAAVHVVAAPAAALLLIPSLMVGIAGVGWSACALTLANRVTSDDRVLRMQGQAHTFRHQLTQIEREIAQLESE